VTSLASLHPIIVHFAIALLSAGAILRWLSLTNRVAFASPAASGLLLVGMVAAFLAVKSGLAAHGPVERIPGAQPAVVAHERWGERAHDVFLVVAAAELAALLLARRGWARPAVIASAVVCVPAVFCLYLAGERGGDLVYSYAGGVGTRSGDPADVGRLLVAAAYNQAQVDRKAGRPADAAAIISVAAARFPSDPGVGPPRQEGPRRRPRPARPDAGAAGRRAPPRASRLPHGRRAGGGRPRRCRPGHSPAARLRLPGQSPGEAAAPGLARPARALT
jgi:uncharacterized membrane protein